MSTPLAWIVVNWRLKLLALVLAVGLLGAVAFSENPPEMATVPVKVTYQGLPSNLVLIDPPSSVQVRVVGLQDDVRQYRQSAAGVTIDLSHATVGDHLYEARPRVDVQGVTPQDTDIPLHLRIEELRTVMLGVEVRTPRKAAGIAVVPSQTYATCGNANEPCQVTVTGPSELVDGLHAYVDYDVAIQSANVQRSPDQTILFEKGGHQVDLKSWHTIPPPSWTPNVVTVQVATVGGTTTRTVGLTVHPIGVQACGYAITGVDIQPSGFVTVSGPISQVARLGDSIGLDPVDISGLTSTQSFTRTVRTGSDQVTAAPASVRVVVSVTPAFSCAAPTPGTAGSSAAGPSPSPLPSPRPSSPP
jgi:YbbR domain-containing protein